MALMIVGGCASVPQQLDRPLSEPHPAPHEVQRSPDQYRGQVVRWGGTIAAVENTREGSVIEVVARPLENTSRPRENEMSPGRFLIVTDSFLDPEVYTSGKSVTAVGALEGVDVRNVGDFEYPYPVLRAEALHLWPPRPERRADPYPDPWLYPYHYPYWGHPYWRHRYPYRYW